MAISITIRDVPDAVRDTLAARAARSGRSLQEYLSLQLRELADRPSIDDAIAEIRARAVHYPSVNTAEILEAIDADRK
ncbi:FitA-like ribbon-helix-helix domain-containing protein [Marisediminicola senii]|uniref:FitA-like ribbon-helix-helix domain-containing protein n=1 Tax=Marisediminicola senii TaxID=2711233 RepID=UPI0013ED059D|nr:hypothetical protein [Marisediminicola senii]